MSSLSKRFSQVLFPKDITDSSVPATSVDKSAPDPQAADATNGAAPLQNAKDSTTKSTPTSGATAQSKPKEQKSKPPPTTKKDKTSSSGVGKSTIKRFSSILRPRSNGKSAKPKGESAAAANTAKIPKKGAAKGKRVIVVTGASKGIGLEFVKQFVKQPDTFVIALSRTADKASSLRPIVSASVKEGHNVRAIKVDITSTRSVNNAVKDIVELTDGRIDLIVNAAGSKGDPALKAWEIKGSELEDELRNNLVGPITFTNALIPYLKPFVKEDKKDELEKKKTGKEEKQEEKKTEKKEGNEEEKKEQKEEVKEERKDDKQEAKETNVQEDKTEAKAEKDEGKEGKPEADSTPVPSTAPAPHPPVDTAGTLEEPSLAEPMPERALPVEPSPALLPSHPFILFLAPADPIHNVGGVVNAEQSWIGSPRTLFSLSRAALQVAIAKYAVGLASRGVGVVAVERHGYNDPHSSVTDEQAVAAVLKLLPNLIVHDNGKLLQASP